MKYEFFFIQLYSTLCNILSYYTTEKNVVNYCMERVYILENYKTTVPTSGNNPPYAHVRK